MESAQHTYIHTTSVHAYRSGFGTHTFLASRIACGLNFDLSLPPRSTRRDWKSFHLSQNRKPKTEKPIGKRLSRGFACLHVRFCKDSFPGGSPHRRRACTADIYIAIFLSKEEKNLPNLEGSSHRVLK